MATQLRDYRVRPEEWNAFIRAWSSQVPPLRAAHGFNVEAWAAPEEGRLLWLLSYPGDVDEFEKADRAYYASSAREAFDPDPRTFLTRSDHHFVERVSLPG